MSLPDTPEPDAPSTQSATGEYPGHVLAEFVQEPPVELRRRRRVVLPLVLFFVTCASTFYAGLFGFDINRLAMVNSSPQLFLAELPRLLAANWQSGLTYMLAVMGILLAHEMGHFLQAVRYGVPASLPFFIPLPITPLGTMGAVIGMEKSSADRKQLFDIGLTGPLAGLVLAVPITCMGIREAVAVPGPINAAQHFGDPLIIELLIPMVRPDLPYGTELMFNPLLMAGWVGMLITGLNMFPISQLDGGHVVYALFPHYARWIVRVVLMCCIAGMVLFDLPMWIVMLGLVLVIGIDHPRTANDAAPLGPWRWLIGVASLTIPFLCFVPRPLPTGM